MKQYCRYCANAYIVDDDLIYCDQKDETRDKKNCITPNKCKKFLINSIDVFDMEKEYKPRQAYKPRRTQAVEAGQVMFESGGIK